MYYTILVEEYWLTLSCRDKTCKLRWSRTNGGLVKNQCRVYDSQIFVVGDYRVVQLVEEHFVDIKLKVPPQFKLLLLSVTKSLAWF